MTEEQEWEQRTVYQYMGVTVGHFSIAFDKIAYIETFPAATDSEESGLAVFFSCGGFIHFKGQDAENFYKSYRTYLGYYHEVDEDEELCPEELPF